VGLRHRRTIILTTLGAFVASCFLLRSIGKTSSRHDESQFTVFIKEPVGTRMEVTEKRAMLMEKTIRDAVGDQNVQTIVTSTGIPMDDRRCSPPTPGPIRRRCR